MKKFIFYFKENFFYVFVFILFFSCQVERKSEQKSSEEYPDIVLNGYTHNVYSNGKKLLVLIAEKAEFWTKKNEITMEKIDMEMYEDNKIVSRGKAGKGTIDQKTRNGHFYDQVHLESMEHETEVDSETMDWKNKENLLVTDEKVFVKKADGSTVIAKGMEANVNLERVTFKEEVSGIYYYDEDRQEDEE